MTAHFGLDIGSYSIKLVEGEKKGKEWRLVTFGEAKTPVDINSDAPKDKVALSETIKKLCQSCRVTTKNVVFSLSETEVFSQVIELPYFNDAELATAINFEAEQYIPVPLDEVQLEYLVLKRPPKGSSEKMEVLLVGAKKRILEKKVEILEAAGLIPKAAETETLALIRCLEKSNKGVYFVVDLGFRSTDLMIVLDGVLKFVRTIPSGGEA
ncbi:MAG: pilus assembly protein PilM, partial [Candidatus Omnitrophica bacterium]|nr:pilus assembly protein PilM [Candidatus Omnitrophota bacterium]